MSQTMPVVPRGPVTYDQLKALRSSYALIVLGIVVVSWCLSGAVLQRMGRSQNVFSSPLLFVTLGALPALGYAIVTGFYASKVGMPSPVIPALFAPWPFLQWVAFFMVVGYIPGHLKQFKPVENPPRVTTWVIVACSPLILMGFLTAVNYNYMGQLFFGSPVGAYIPGLPIPCGWPILEMICLGVLLANIYLWFGFQKGLVRGGWKALLAILVLTHFTLPSVWLVLLGPALIQVFKQYVSGH